MRLDEFKVLLEKRCGLISQAPVLVGVSGGPDSLCLADLLHKLKIPMIIAHFDHQLRPTSGTEAELVRSYAETREIPYLSGSRDVGKYAKQEKLSTEEGARKARYLFLFDDAEKHGAQAVATGHTADDQVETILMHLLRGSGMAGMRGMAMVSKGEAWRSTIPLIRPLLTTWRSETLDYCHENHLEPSWDESNQDPLYYRNRIRMELIPLLESYNPKIKQHLIDTANLIRDDYSVLSDFLETFWIKSLISENPHAIAMDCDYLKSLKPGLQRGIIRKAISILQPGLRDLDYSTVKRVIDFIHHPPKTKYEELFKNYSISTRDRKLIIHERGKPFLDDQWLQIRRDEIWDLDLGETKEIEGWQFSCNRKNSLNHDWQTYLEKDPHSVFIDHGLIDFPLKIRTQRAGDRFAPFGMAGHSKKLSDFWINSGLPREARDHWPLVCSNDEIIWIPGYRISEKVRINENTRKVVQIRLKKVD